MSILVYIYIYCLNSQIPWFWWDYCCFLKQTCGSLWDCAAREPEWSLDIYQNILEVFHSHYTWHISEVVYRTLTVKSILWKLMMKDKKIPVILHEILLCFMMNYVVYSSISFQYWFFQCSKYVSTHCLNSAWGVHILPLCKQENRYTWF